MVFYLCVILLSVEMLCCFLPVSMIDYRSMIWSQVDYGCSMLIADWAAVAVIGYLPTVLSKELGSVYFAIELLYLCEQSWELSNARMSLNVDR